MNNSKKKGHYGYIHYSRKDVVEGYDQDRYGSSFGKYLYDMEIENFLHLLSNDGKVLDIGTGTGKLFSSLQSEGRLMAGVDASLSMISLLKSRIRNRHSGIRLYVADALKLPFKDNAFDSVLSSRVLMHLFAWKLGIREFCRVSRNEIIFDFPPVSGFTILIPLINRIQRLLYKDTCPYNVFSVASVKRELERNNFKVIEVRRLFFLPVGVHRYINNIFISRLIEALFAGLRITNVFGGPVLMKATRIE